MVFVIDSSDRKQFETSKHELRQLFSNSEIKDSVFLILANKQDLEESLSVKEISEEFGLNEVVDNTWSIYGVSVKEGLGIQEAFDWLTNQLKKAKDQKKN